MTKMFSFRRFVTLVVHYLYSMKRNPARFIEIVVWPSFELILFGMLALSIHKTADATLSTSINILSGVVYWNFTARVVQESVAQFLDDAFSKNLQNLFISPFSLLELSLSLVTSSIIKLCFSSIFLLFIINLLFPSYISSLTVTSGVLLFELIIFGSILSIFALSFIFIFGARASFVGWFISTTLQIFSCVFFERNILPNILYTLSFVVPSSYIFESVRSITSRQTIASFTQPVIITLLFTYLIVAVGFLYTTYAYARKSGLLTKL